MGISKVKSVLFVCSGNTCRSPLAEAILKKLLENGDLSGISVSSAGISAIDGASVSYNAVRIALDEDINISGHRTKKLTHNKVVNSDLVIVMENRHRQQILEMCSQVEGKIFLLRNFAQFGSKTRNIFDPYGPNIEKYRFCFQDIQECVTGLYQLLKTQGKRISTDWSFQDYYKSTLRLPQNTYTVRQLFLLDSASWWWYIGVNLDTWNFLQKRGDIYAVKSWNFVLS